MNVVVTQHAAERYVERVKPALTVSQAAVEIRHLAELAGEPTEKPSWVINEERREQMDGWLPISDGICLPLHRVNGRWVARTILTRAGLSPERRSSRRDAKRRRKKRDRKTSRAERLGREEAA